MQIFEKWEICEAICVDLNAEFGGHVESMCLGRFRGLVSETPDEVWDFFEYLAWETWEFEQDKEALVHSSSDPYAFHFQLYHQHQFRDLCFQEAFVPPVLCDYCQSSSHEMRSCPLFTNIDALEHWIADMMG